MGITKDYEVTNNFAKNWKNYCETEIKSSKEWTPKWGWMIRHYRELGDKLNQLKQQYADLEEKVKKEDKRDVKPLPNSTAHEFGWLSTRPEFNLEIYGPYPYTKQDSLPINPPNLFINH